MFSQDRNRLISVVEQTLSLAESRGAEAAEADIYESVGLEVGVRLREPENIEWHRDGGLNLTVYLGHRKGSASTTDFSEQAVADTVNAAISIARNTEADAAAELAERDRMAKAEDIEDLDLWHEWQPSVEEATQIALRCEDAALACDPRIANSEGATLSTGHSCSVYANSHGFCAYDRRTGHSLSCTAVAADRDGMQSDWWSDIARARSDLQSPEEIGTAAARRALARLGAGKLKTGIYPVVFDRTVARGLIGHLSAALSGGTLFRKRSFLCDSLGQKILPDWVDIREEPRLRRTFSTACYDDDGVATIPRDIIKNGVVCSYFLSHYSARKLGMKSTANAGGVHHLVVSADIAGREDLLRRMGRGVLITDLMGQGVNLLTGDYSRGASGFWVENGEIAYPVHEITVAGNLKTMFADIAGIAGDALPHRSHDVGSILIGHMTVSR